MPDIKQKPIVIGEPSCYCIEVTLKNGVRKKFEYTGFFNARYALRDYLIEKMVEQNHPEQFSSKELLDADWMPTQTVVLNEFWVSSLTKVAKMAKDEYDYRYNKRD